MQRLIWLLSFIPVRINIFLFGGVDAFALYLLYGSDIMNNSLFFNRAFLIAMFVVLLILFIVMAVVGWRIGREYVEMGRSRQWHYRATQFSRFNNEFSNIMYWTGKMACLPIMICTWVVFVYLLIMFINQLNPIL